MVLVKDEEGGGIYVNIKISFFPSGPLGVSPTT